MTTFQLHQLIIAVTITFMGNAASAADSSALPDAPSVIVDKGIAPSQQESMSLAARRYYAFWNTGDASFAKAALDSNFIDRTLPTGRPQGIEGPLFASRNFRAAVPDLVTSVDEMLLVGDRVVGRLHFTGHFTGHFNGVQGKGQKVDFIATDIYRIADGRIAENWHLEDNLTLLQQLGIVGH
ncbi:MULTISPECIES: ester cyclase [Undibacterium]|uniref:Ester cyclase n=1 Tax=Undibacterium aquatile TaxID=1537398 RepID=A0ABR6XE02_9BURK|nr:MULTISPECIES: ester cyclase [Undibacterium]MBC3811128.1 ester cyclase [Undibacterium aquatile]MBC3928594.1 ester cyclase [Undibacterium sp. CY21W]